MERSCDNSVLDFPILIPSLSPTSMLRPCSHWTFKSLAQDLEDKQLTCRVWRKCDQQVLETACDHVDISMEQFYAWLMSTPIDGNPLKGYERSSHAAYIDYKYIKDVFSDCPQKLKEVQWRDFGLPEFDGKDSTIWIGSEGANTSGHQDSYGFNLVSQIVGRKMWVLFPPSDTEHLYPTRVPYEESSVFTQVHVGCPDVGAYPALKMSHPVVIILHPGQTLYVPRHWWHYVESLDPSISINVWVPHKDDSESHLTESVSRYLATFILRELEERVDTSLLNKLLNPTETLYSQTENVEFINEALRKVLQQQQSAPSPDNDLQREEEAAEHSGKNNSMEGLPTCGGSEIPDYFSHFGNWIQNSCCVFQAPTHPCLGFGGEHCESYTDGCITTPVVGVFDGKGNSSSSDRAAGLIHKNIDEEMTTNSKEHASFLRKRANKIENCNLTPFKKVKNVEEPKCLPTNEDEKHLNDNHPRLEPSLSENVSMETGTDGKGKSGSFDQTSVVVYSLSKPFSFELFLHLIKLKCSSSSHHNGKEKSHSTNNCVLCSPDQSGTGSRLVDCPDKTASDVRLSRRDRSDSDFDCSGCSSSRHKQPTMESCSSSSSSSPAVIRFCPSRSSFASPSPSLSSNRPQNRPTLSDNNNDGDDEGNRNGPVPSSFLSEAAMKQLLFESIIHPSVVEHISGLFKGKCQTLLNLNRKLKKKEIK